MPRPTPSTLLLPFVVSLALAGLRNSGVRAQITSNATCLSNWRDLYNSRGQSPCLVGAYLGGACNGGQYDVGALLEDEHYIGPTILNANGCLCSTVMYTVMGACSTCQNATIISWNSWSSSCSEVNIQHFPEDIPQDTAVPGWAYGAIPSSGTFDINQVLADTSSESTATFVQSTNTGTGTRSGTSTSTASSGSSQDEDDDEGGGSNTGAIAGGVVGGIVGVAAIGLLGFFLYRRNNRNQNNTNKLNAIHSGSGSGIGGGGGGGVHANLTGSTYAGGAGAGVGPGGLGQYEPVPYTPHAYEGGALSSPPMMGQKLYDPNDPSTFPTAASPPPVSMNTQTTGSGSGTGLGSGANLSYAPSFPQPQPHQVQVPQQSNQGMYRGVAEI